ncbi:MAG: tetratricopeptide repeat protein [Planctomycetes bacterium]|nr:tetratricopeptide repeat protein [Planctomycetota bacterium]
MKSLPRQFSVAAAAVAVVGCASQSGGSPPRLDHLDGAGAPVFQPMLVVPLPALQTGAPAPGRQVEALQARNSPVGDVLLTLFRDSDINLLIEPDVQAAACTFDIKRATIEEAFEALLQSQDLGYEWDGSFLRVSTMVRDTVHVDIMDASSQPSGSEQSSSPTGDSGSASGASRFWEEVQTNLPSLLGDGGSYVVNRTASSIHVRARPSGVGRLREYVGTTMRRANQQVSLEARILEVRLDDEYSLGVNWSLLPGLFNSNKVGQAGGGAVLRQAAASGGAAFSFGILDTNDFSLFVDALEQQGQVRVLSSPRVSTMNNQPAAIGVTDQIPYITREILDDQGVARTEFGVEFVEAGVTLDVRPMIGDDGMLSVSITPQVREQTGTVVTPDGLVTVPIIAERQATTSVRVADGQAIAIGGLRSTRKSETRQGVPFLMNVPLLGQLFSNTVQERGEVELMIVLVPRVLDDTWITEEIARGSHRLVQLRRDFQWNAIGLDGYRPEDWSGGSLQGDAQAATRPGVRVPDARPAEATPDRGATITRRGLAGHLLAAASRRLAAGDQANALHEIDRALQLEPDRAEALIAAAVLCERRGERARARQLFDRALERNPDDVIGLSGRGALELDDGSPFAARRYFERAHLLGQTPLTAANLAAALLALGDCEAARELLVGARRDDAPPELHGNLAFAQLQLGQVQEARESLRRALAAGADARNPRLVALDRLIGDAEQAAAAAAAAAGTASAPASDG